MFAAIFQVKLDGLWMDYVRENFADYSRDDIVAHCGAIHLSTQGKQVRCKVEHWANAGETRLPNVFLGKWNKETDCSIADQGNGIFDASAPWDTFNS